MSKSSHLDATVSSAVYLVKFYRLMSMWVVIYVMEKIYLQRYLQKVYIEDTTPPNLWHFVLMCSLVESVIFGAAMLVMFMLSQKYGGGTGFVIDKVLIYSIGVDYIFTTWIFVVAGLGISSVIQNCKLLRYSHDGMRGIRAYATIVFYIFILITTLPFNEIA